MADRPMSRRQLCLKLAGEVECDPRTVDRWLSGAAVVRPIANALEAAVEELGLRDAAENARESARGEGTAA
jgi:hypothetical protein